MLVKGAPGDTKTMLSRIIPVEAPDELSLFTNKAAPLISGENAYYFTNWSALFAKDTVFSHVVHVVWEITHSLWDSQLQMQSLFHVPMSLLQLLFRWTPLEDRA